MGIEIKRVYPSNSERGRYWNNGIVSLEISVERGALALWPFYSGIVASGNEEIAPYIVWARGANRIVVASWYYAMAENTNGGLKSIGGIEFKGMIVPEEIYFWRESGLLKIGMERR